MAIRKLSVIAVSGDDAFNSNPILEARRILSDIRERLNMGSVAGKCKDSNGNTVGEWSLTVEEE